MLYCRFTFVFRAAEVPVAAGQLACTPGQSVPGRRARVRCIDSWRSECSRLRLVGAGRYDLFFVPPIDLVLGMIGSECESAVAEINHHRLRLFACALSAYPGDVGD